MQFTKSFIHDLAREAHNELQKTTEGHTYQGMKHGIIYGALLMRRYGEEGMNALLESHAGLDITPSKCFKNRWELESYPFIRTLDNLLQQTPEATA